MTSSKFGGKIPPFKVPPICKDKTPPGEEEPPGNPLPGDPLSGEFSIHGSVFGNRWDRDGPLSMAKITDIRWESPIPPPPEGEVIIFNWNEGALVWSGTLLLYTGGSPLAVFNKPTSSYSPNGSFDTETFEWPFGFGWSGETKTGRYHN